MKKILLTILAVAAICLSTQAQAPIVNNNAFAMPTNVVAIPTWTIAASTTTNVGLAADFGKQSIATFQISFKLATAGTNGHQVFVFDRSNDGTTYTTLNNSTIQIDPNGTTTVCVVTNLPLLGARYVRLKSWQNQETDTTAPVTNAAVSYLTKVSAP